MASINFNIPSALSIQGVLTIANGINRTPIANTLAQICGPSAAASVVALETEAAAGQYVLRRANNAGAAIANGDSLGAFAWQGMGSSVFSTASRAYIQATSTEAWTNTAQGLMLEFFVTPAGGVLTAVAAQLRNTGLTVIGQVVTAASTTALASLNLPHGAAPTSPVNGDIWTTTSGVFARISGSTVGPFGTGAGGTITLTGDVTGSGTTTIATTVNWPVPGTIGSTTPNTGAFTTLSATTITTTGKVAFGTAVDSNYGLISSASLSGATVFGMAIKSSFTATNNLQTWTNALFTPTLLATGAFTNLTFANVLIGTPTVTGSANFANTYQLYIDAGLSGYGIYQAGTEANLLNGSLTIGGALVTVAPLNLPAATISKPSLNILQGVAPLFPNNGDIWTTTTGLFAYINGSVKGPIGVITLTGDVTGTGSSSVATTVTWGTPGTIGSGTPNTGAFTTLTTTGNITLTKPAGAFTMISSAGRPTIVHRSTGTTSSNTDTPVFQFNRATNALPSGTLVGEMRFDGLNTGSTYTLYGMISVQTTGAATATGSPSRMDFNVGDGTTTQIPFQLGGAGAFVLGTFNATGAATFQNDVNINRAAGTNYLYYNSDLQIAKNGTGPSITIDSSRNVAVTGTITSGTASGTTGALILKGATSGTFTMSVNDAAGTWTAKWPSTAGTSGFSLTTDGSGNLAWTNVSAGGSGVTLTDSPTWTGIHTWTPTARTSGFASYFTVNTPTDTGITAATESVGINFATGVRTWATTGTVALQREILFAGKTYASASASQTFIDIFTAVFTPPIQGSNAIITRGHSVGIVDTTSAVSSITGAFIVASVVATSATSVGIGAGNIYAGATITGNALVSNATLSVATTSTLTGNVGIGAAPSSAVSLGVGGTPTGANASGIQIFSTLTASANSQTLFSVTSYPTISTVTYTTLNFINWMANTVTVTGSGAISNSYQLYISAGAAATNKYGIYQVGSDSNVFGGSLYLNGSAANGQFKAGYSLFTAAITQYDSSSGGLYLAYTSGNSIIRSVADNSGTTSPISIQCGNGTVIGTFSSTGLTMSSGLKIVQPQAPASGSDLCNKTYVDSVAGGGGSYVVNVKSYGATGNGSTDDTAAIVSAMAALTNYSTLYFPAGKYKMSLNTLTFVGVNHITITGDGRSSVLYNTDTTPAGNHYMVLFDTTSESITLKDFSIVCSSTSRVSGAHGVILGAAHSLVSGVYVTGTGDFGIYASYGGGAGWALDIQFVNCLCDSTLGDGYHFGSVKDSGVYGCIANNTGDDGIGIGDDGATGYPPTRVEVSGFSTNLAGGIGSSGAGVRIFDGAVDIHINGGSATTSREAGLVTCRFSSTTAFNTRITINGFKAYNCFAGGAGMYGQINFQFTNQLLVSGCWSEAPQHNACYGFLDCNNITVSGCTAKDGAVRGFWTDDGTTTNVASTCSNWTIIGNTCIGNPSNESYYFVAPTGKTITNLIITGNTEIGQSYANYISTGSIAGICKINNNTSATGKGISSGGTLVNNN